MGFGRCHVLRSSLPDCGQLDNRRYPLDITTSFYLGAQLLRLLWAEEETDMTSSNLNSWSRLGFLGDEGKESHHYMGQREASCNCDQNVPNRMSYLDSRWDDGATPGSCLCIFPAHTQGTALTETWADKGDSSAAHFLWPINTLCHQSLRLSGTCGWSSGLSHRHAHLPVRICSFRSDLVSTEKWQFCTYLKQKAVCGCETKYEF